MAKIYAISGQEKSQITLPKVFTTPYRPDLIQKSVLAAQSSTRQKHASFTLAGLQTSGDYYGSRRNTYRQTINKALTHLPRIKKGGGGLGDVVRVPQAKGGRKAHPPLGKDHSRKINRKEYNLALNSAISATKDKKLVEDRGHKILDKELPLIVEDKIESIKKTKDARKILEDLGFTEELSTRKKKKILIVVGEDKGILAACYNIPGVDVATTNDLDLDLLAPGAKAGRLTIWSESAIKKL